MTERPYKDVYVRRRDV